MFERIIRRDAPADVRQREQLVAGEVHRPHLVLPPLEHLEPDHQRVRRGMDHPHVLDLKIQVAVLAVIIGQRIPVVREIVAVQHPRTRQPGPHSVLGGLDLFAQHLLLEGRGPVKFNGHDFDLRTFHNVEGHDGVAGRLFGAHAVFHRGIRVAVFFIQLLHVLGLGEQFLLVQRIPDLGGEFFAELGLLHLFIALEPDLRHAQADLHRISEHHAAVIRQLSGDADVVKLTRAVERMDVVLGEVDAVNIAGLEPDVGADKLLAHGGRPDELDVHPVNFRAGVLRPRGRGAAEQEGGAHQAAEGFHPLIGPKACLRH